jgi:hypothetical protein
MAGQGGRVDLLAVALLERLVGQVEERTQLPGLGDLVRPHIGPIVQEYMGEIELDPGVMALAQWIYGRVNQ